MQEGCCLVERSSQKRLPTPHAHTTQDPASSAISATTELDRGLTPMHRCMHKLHCKLALARSKGGAVARVVANHAPLRL